LTSTEDFTEILSCREFPPGEGLNARREAKYRDFGHIESYISETVQDRR